MVFLWALESHPNLAISILYAFLILRLQEGWLRYWSLLCKIEATVLAGWPRRYATAFVQMNKLQQRYVLNRQTDRQTTRSIHNTSSIRGGMQ